MFQSPNIGTVDRVLRIIVGLLLAVYAYSSLASPWSFVAYAVAAVLVVTALVRVCLAYRLLGISTCSIGRSR